MRYSVLFRICAKSSFRHIVEINEHDGFACFSFSCISESALGKQAIMLFLKAKHIGLIYHALEAQSSVAATGFSDS